MLSKWIHSMQIALQWLGGASSQRYFQSVGLYTLHIVNLVLQTNTLSVHLFIACSCRIRCRFHYHPIAFIQSECLYIWYAFSLSIGERRYFWLVRSKNRNKCIIWKISHANGGEWDVSPVCRYRVWFIHKRDALSCYCYCCWSSSSSSSSISYWFPYFYIVIRIQNGL